jgi:protein AroM
VPTIGFAGIGQTPDTATVSAICSYLPKTVSAVEAGCLDGLSRSEIDALGPDADEVGIACDLLDGSSILLSHTKLLPRMQVCVDQLSSEHNADTIVILCGADWSSITSPTLVINPGSVFPSVISALSAGRKLGVIKPSAGQIESEATRYSGLGIDVHVTAASPFCGPERLSLAQQAATEIRDANCDLVWMTCVSMDQPMKKIVSDITGKPVILAHELLAKIISTTLPA